MLTYLSLSPPLSCSPFSLLFYALREKRHFKCRTKLLKHALSPSPFASCSRPPSAVACHVHGLFTYMHNAEQREKNKQANTTFSWDYNLRFSLHFSCAPPFSSFCQQSFYGRNIQQSLFFLLFLLFFAVGLRVPAWGPACNVRLVEKTLSNH